MSGIIFSSKQSQVSSSTPFVQLMTTLPTSTDDPCYERLAEIELAYGRFVPRQFLNLLGVEDIRKAQISQQVECEMTILFADIHDFTALAETISPQETFNFLNSYLVQMEPVITAHGGIIDKYIGDGIMVLFPAAPDDALRCSLAMLAKLAEYNLGRERAGYMPIRIGIGINTGIVTLGTVGGRNRMDGTVIGDAVNLAARLERLTKFYDVPVLTSEHTLQSLADPAPWLVRLIDRAKVRGKQHHQPVFEVFNADPSELRNIKQQNVELFEKALAHYHLGDLAGARARFDVCHMKIPDDHPTRMYLEYCSAPNTGSTQIELAAPWREEFVTGDTTIDSEHRIMLFGLNALARAVYLGSSALVPLLMTKIIAATERTFAAEEEIMKTNNYQFCDLHLRQHRYFMAALNDVRQELIQGSDDSIHTAFHVRQRLTDWLIDHILTADRHLTYRYI